MMPSILAAGDNPLSHVVPHYYFHPGGGNLISNHLVMGTISALIVLIVAKWMAGKINPAGKTQAEDFVTKGFFPQLIETLCEFIYDFVAKPQLKHLTDKYIAYIWTMFFFVLTCNLMGLIPFGYFFHGVGTLAGAESTGIFKYLGGTATSNLSLNVPLALVSFVAVIYIGIKETGFKHFVNHFNPIGWDDKKLAPIGAMIFVLEWVGLVIKCAVLAFRLFGTMLAGHLVLAVLIGLIFKAAAALGDPAGYGIGIAMTILSVLMFCLEIFVAFLQAFIFTFLTTLFIAMTAVTHDHDHDHVQDAVHEDYPGDGPSIGEVIAEPNVH